MDAVKKAIKALGILGNNIMRNAKFDEKSAEKWRGNIRRDGLHAARARRGRASISEQTATHKYTSIYIHSTIPRRAVGLESSCTVSHEGDILTTEMCCTALLSFVHTVGKHVCFTSSLSDKLSSSRPLENFGQLELSGERERERERER